MLPKMEKEKLFTIIYADILIFASLCQFLPKMEKAGCFKATLAKMRLPPPPNLQSIETIFMKIRNFFVQKCIKFSESSY